MNLYDARKLTEKLTEKYLFSKQLEFAGFEEEELADERIADIFHSVIGLGIGLVAPEEYIIHFYHTAPISDKHLIAEEYKVLEEELVFELTEPFVAQPIKRISAALASILFSQRNVHERPMRIGSSVGRFRSNEFGSAGCFVKNDRGETYLLSNRHVLFDADSQYDDKFIVQPGGNTKSNPEDVIGLYYKSLPFNPDDVNEFDAALAGPLSCEVTHEISGAETGAQRSLQGVEAPEQNTRVYKYGAASKLTYGVIMALEVNAVINFGGKDVSFKNLIVVRGTDKNFNGRQIFSRGGDSGSTVITTEDKLIGLLFAGSTRGLSLACPAEKIFSQFGVDLF